LSLMPVSPRYGWYDGLYEKQREPGGSLSFNHYILIGRIYAVTQTC
jgi:hypothetical protein